ncbi:hypothetical protein PQR08_30895 [Caballeronia jiangsuensis]|uniref:Uncharacterized protein n=1 Tax=Caballeronia jiangsuensis TaxID=1458357 RepID=A0ABW9CTE1_9BURK
MATLVSALVFIVGWFVAHDLAARRDLSARRENGKRGHIERQISELYGPLLGLIEDSGATFDIAARKLLCNDRGGIDFHRFSPEDDRFWRYFIERYFIPINAQIRMLIRTKMHLLEDGRLSDSFAEFSGTRPASKSYTDFGKTRALNPWMFKVPRGQQIFRMTWSTRLPCCARNTRLCSDRSCRDLSPLRR